MEKIKKKYLHTREGEEQGSKAPSSLLFEPISPSSLTFTFTSHFLPARYFFPLFLPPPNFFWAIFFSSLFCSSPFYKGQWNSIRWTQAGVFIAAIETGADDILCSWLTLVCFHCTKNDLLWLRANTRSVIFVISPRWKFETYQLVSHQILLKMLVNSQAYNLKRGWEVTIASINNVSFTNATLTVASNTSR